MIQSPNQIDRQHRAIQTESRVGGFMPMRMCAGPCKRRRSIGQFVGNSVLCLRCARRSK